MADPGYWPSRWPGEDGGPQRRQAPHSGEGLGLQPGEHLVATSREALAGTMVVLREPGEAYLLRHTGGDGAISWVERFHPETLEVIERSPDLPGGPTWPGGVAAHANGSLYVAFGRHVHRLASDCSLVASVELPRNRPYNSFVILPDGHLVTKDFAGSRPGGEAWSEHTQPSELLVLTPDLEVVASLELPEPSIARLSADGDDVYVVGDTSLFRARWTGDELVLDVGFTARYRTMPGQTYGWDAVIDAGAAWFLDNGDGSERYIGTFRGQGVSSAPLHLVRVDLATGTVTLTEICGLPNGVIANPPAIDAQRRIAVGYDSGNGVVAAFSFDEAGATTPLWQKQMDHACHPLRFPDTGELVLAHHDRERNAEQVVVLDISTGDELARVDTGSPVQSAVFPAVGFGRDLYTVSFLTLSRITVA
jgi:sugar lactone lactonase YvrE